MGSWGGKRKGAGRKANPDKTPRRFTAKQKQIDPPSDSPKSPITVAAEPKRMNFDAAAWADFLPRLEEISRKYAVGKSERARIKVPEFPKAAIPTNPKMHLAMDAEIKEVISYGNAVSASGFGAVVGEGLLFLGYTYLAELAQRPEYRVMAETIADDSTRKWIEFDITGDKKENDEAQAKDPEGFAERMADPDEKKKRIQNAGKLDRVKELEDDQKRLGVQQAFYQASRIDNFFGRSHLFLDIRTVENGVPEPDRDEIKTDVGDASFGNETSRTKVPLGSLKAIRLIEPMWAYPILYNANNPLRADWYNPQQWYVMGQEIHQSRLMTFVGHPVPDILKPAYAFGGLALTQMAKPYVDIWLQTRQSVAEMIHAYSVMVLGTDLSQVMEPNGQAALLARVALFNILRDNQGLFVHNKDTEEFKNVSATIAGLDKLQAQAQEHMSSVSRIPLVKLTGISPSGLNATSEFEIEVYDDTIEAYQERFHEPKLDRVIHFEMLSLWGEIDPEITFHFAELRQMTQAEKGQKVKDEAETMQKYVDMGAFAPEEIRRIAIEDEDLPFGDLDPDDVPPPPAEEGVVPGEGDKPEVEASGDGGSEGGGKDRDYGAGDRAMAWDGVEWKEDLHKRDDGGKFSAGSGGGGGGSAPVLPFAAPAPKTNIGAPIDLKSLQKVGKQMGSNPGGVYQGADGKQYYVKQGKTPAHVKNELIAGALYHLAGTPTLKYRPVAGGGHIATEMTQLDKDNSNKFDEKQRSEAKKDFAVHAWLGNWDAAGTGGDNLGIVRGRPTALDVGGALEFRAQGAPKGKAFGDKVTELQTLKDKNIATRDAFKVFGDMSPSEMRESASFVTSIPDKEIIKTVEQLGGDPALAQKLIARKNDIAKQAELFGSDPDPVNPDSSVVFTKDGKLPVKELNGKAFSPWQAPESNREWANVDGQADIDEPEFVIPGTKRPGTGVIMREPDGRIWLMRPKNGYGGYQHTFPKGGLERGLPPQANAIKEAYEETGLKAKITGFAGDHEGDTSFTRYYFAERDGGDPSKTTWESDGVVLSPASKLNGFLNRSRDKKIAASLGQAHDEMPRRNAGFGNGGSHDPIEGPEGEFQAQVADEAKFEEDKHPRDDGGKFTSGGGGGGGAAAAPDKDGKEELKKDAPYGGLYVTAHGEDKSANHHATVTKILKGPTQVGIHYRRMLAQLLKEGPGFKMGPDVATSIKDKLGEAWGMAAISAKKKGKDEEAAKAYKKAVELGYKGPGVPGGEAAKPAPSPAHAPAPAPPKPPEPAKPPVVKTDFPPPTAAELEKAKKSVALQPQYIPGDKPEIAGSYPHKLAMTLIQKFNEMYAGKQLTDPAALAKKVNDFKTLTSGINALAKAEAGDKAKVQAAAAEKAKAESAKKAEAAAAEAKKNATANKQIMADLGLNEQHAEGFHALAKMLGAEPHTLAQNFKKYEAQATSLGYPISGFQCALIKNYSNGGFHGINEALRSGSWTPAQHIYASMVNQALLSMPKHTGNVTRNTTLTPEQLAVYKEGHVVQEHALTSTSTGSVFSGNTQYKIKAIGKRGAHIKKLSNHPDEDEVLFAAKTYFRVNKIEKGGNGHTTIHMEEWDAPL